MKIYLDSCIAISLIEGTNPVRTSLNNEIERRASQAALYVSGAVKAECLVAPYRNNDVRLLDQYQTFFDGLNFLEVGDAAWSLAARLRARTRLKFPDALHLAIAEYNRCDAFWTVDRDFHALNYPLHLDIVLTQI